LDLLPKDGGNSVIIAMEKLKNAMNEWAEE
jgi:hypothetical protein